MDKESNQCIVCGEIVYSKSLCYSHLKLMRRLKIHNESLPVIRQTILEAERILKDNRSLKHKEDTCNICGQPCDGELCAMHRKINNFLNKD